MTVLYRLVAPPVIEQHEDNVIRLFVRDVDGAPVASTHVRVWGGPPPSGSPPYFTDDFPYRATDLSGMLEYHAHDGPMPETRDYWLQILANDGTLQGEPIQCHFPQGSTIWITAMVRACEGDPPKTPKPSSRKAMTGTAPDTWDTRLDLMHISVARISEVAPGKSYWKIVSAQFQDETQSGGNHNLYFTVLDERGMPLSGVPVVLDWQGRDPNDIPSTRTTDRDGRANFGLYAGPVAWNPEVGPGPYTAWVGDPDLRGQGSTGISGEKLVGAGLPMSRQVNFLVTWKKTVASKGEANGSRAKKPAKTNAVSLIVSRSAPVRRAQSRVMGTIRNAPPNARLYLANGGKIREAVVDLQGNYAFDGLEAGNFALSVEGIGTVNSSISLDGTNQVTLNYRFASVPSGKPLAHYLLFGSPNLATTRTNLIMALEYITRFAPTLGFSVSEAKQAQNVTIVGNGAVSSAEEKSLLAAGCTVRHFETADSYMMEQLFEQQIAMGDPYPST